MSKLSEDAKTISASNLTLAFFIREHTLYTAKNGFELQNDSLEVVSNFFNEFKELLDK
jgi:hypothetical protein